MALDPHGIGDEFFEALREEFTEEQIAFMSFATSTYIAINTVTETLDLEPEACEIPAE